MKEGQEYEMPENASSFGKIDRTRLLALLPRRTGWHSFLFAGNCPSPETISAYVEHSLNSAQRESLEEHLAECGTCIALISSLVREQDSAEQAEPPNLLVHKAINAAPEKRAPVARWKWVLAPALFAIILMTALLLRSPELPPARPASGPTPEVAQATGINSPGPELRAQRSQVRGVSISRRGLHLTEPRSGLIVDPRQFYFRWSTVRKAKDYEIHIVNSEGDLVWQGSSRDTTVRLPANLSPRAGKYFVWVVANLRDGKTVKSEAVGFVMGSR